MGELFNENGDDGTVACSGIELRPKIGRSKQITTI